MTYDNGVYKCNFICYRMFKYPCAMWAHLVMEDEEWEHWDKPDKDTSVCGMEDPDNRPLRIKIDVSELDTDWHKNWDQYLSDAKEWIENKVKKIITKICCCQEENGLFCDFNEFDIYCALGLMPRFVIQEGHPGPFKDDRKTKRDWKRCCQKCKHSNLKLPTLVGNDDYSLGKKDEMFVNLPDNIFTFSKSFRSVISLTDCQDKSEKIHKIHFEWSMRYDPEQSNKNFGWHLQYKKTGYRHYYPIDIEDENSGCNQDESKISEEEEESYNSDDSETSDSSAINEEESEEVDPVVDSGAFDLGFI